MNLDCFQYMDILLDFLKKDENLSDNIKKNIKKDIPVAAMIVKDNKILTIKKNAKEKDNFITSHAEILAINEANKLLKTPYLVDCDIYVTLEPCPMCAWAIISARFKNIFFGAHDTLYGAFGGAINLKKLANSKINVFSGIREAQCNKVLDDYFKVLRKKAEK